MTKTPWNKNKSVGQKIKELRERLKLDQGRFGQAFGVSQKRVWELENKTKNPSALLLNKIAKTFSVPITYFLDDEQIVSNVEEDILLVNFRRLSGEKKKLAVEIIKILVE